ncbi:uncharacterized protein DSM5745_06956 [Aspergillus mulundensis]|uniref:Inositol polyphosphate-related phosphatase domain-containing protein n=1 Tax=Aspergillus mulundensis TaxID=1810919 RepID=A0A3D8RK64_9EURO|nr:hypothetical protein DSM5745_06956 [Aspergillus mulundensis]RDW74294.1 hypothetical protein DSM5745_06956 [Aspergillus mulundensis]
MEEQPADTKAADAHIGTPASRRFDNDCDRSYQPTSPSSPSRAGADMGERVGSGVRRVLASIHGAGEWLRGGINAAVDHYADVREQIQTLRTIAATPDPTHRGYIRQKQAGKLWVRERLEQLLNADSFEVIGSLPGTVEWEKTGPMREKPVSGHADGASAGKTIYLEKLAVALKLPVIKLVDGSSGGGSVTTIRKEGWSYLPYVPMFHQVIQQLEGGIEVAHRAELREAEKQGNVLKKERLEELEEEYQRLINPVRTANAFRVEEIGDPMARLGVKSSASRLISYPCSVLDQRHDIVVPERAKPGSAVQADKRAIRSTSPPQTSSSSPFSLRSSPYLTTSHRKPPVMESLRLYFFTYNCALRLINVEHFSRHFLDAYPVTDNSNSPPDLIVLSLQEVAPMPYAFLGGSLITPYFASYAQAVDRATVQRFDSQYVNILTEHSGMTALMIFARPDIVDNLSSPEIAKVGFGFQEIGNKAAVASRLSYQSPKTPGAGVDLTLIAAHLAPMEDAVARRNADWRSMVERLVFSGSDGAAKRSDGNEAEDESESAALLPSSSTPDSKHPGIFAPSNYLFIGGDLNYRTADRFPSKNDYRKYPQADADADNPLHFSHLLKNDQLSREMQASRCFHGLTEAPITFPPTYKYHQAAQLAALHPAPSDKPAEWKWTSHRWPSWCDRVLFLNTPPGLAGASQVQVLAYDALPVSPTSDHRPVALTVSIPVLERRAAGESASAQLAPFPIDPDWARKREAALMKEYAVGCLAYVGLTREGNALLLASAVGVIGAWLVVRAMLGS